MRTAIYVDGFNLYYWMKPSPYRWIDLKKLVVNAIARPDKAHEIVTVKYFTARVSDTRDDPTKSTRQDVYIRALRAIIPELTVYFGEFRRQKKQMPLVHYDGVSVGPMRWVWDTEEKGSEARRKQRVVGVLVRGDAEVNSLKRVSTFWKKLRSEDLANALMPREIPSRSMIHIPAEWAAKESAAGVR